MIDNKNEFFFEINKNILSIDNQNEISKFHSIKVNRSVNFQTTTVTSCVYYDQTKINLIWSSMVKKRRDKNNNNKNKWKKKSINTLNRLMHWILCVCVCPFVRSKSISYRIYGWKDKMKRNNNKRSIDPGNSKFTHFQWIFVHTHRQTQKNYSQISWIEFFFTKQIIKWESKIPKFL